ncbi:MAG: excinuclease ABC subunit UvrB [Candidatus Zixiibacteriota bacterium]
MPRKFDVVSKYEPMGDQPKAIEKMVEFINSGHKYSTLLGVTGSGKTYTMAKVLEQINRPTLIISHNKTLAAQLFGEFKTLLPNNAVEYFISYYDYYQPEAYIPSSDTYIEKDADINEQIDRLRLRATSSLMERHDVAIVSSVSCIYGLGSPEDYRDMSVAIEVGKEPFRDDILHKLVAIHYTRNAIDFSEGTFRVRGDVIEIFPPYAENPYRVEFFGDEPERIVEIDRVTGELLDEHDKLFIYGARHFVTPHEKIKAATMKIRKELSQRLRELRQNNKLLAAERLETRTNYDLELMLELGYCSGIENYSRHLAGREEGERPGCLMDYFPDDFLVIIDESHVTLPQLRAMYNGDRSRKMSLVEHGFRLPSALDNRPLYFEEFLELANQVVFVSATPGDFEKEKSGDAIVELINRPTGLIDPKMQIRPTDGQVDDLLGECRKRVDKKERVLVTTLTKKMAEQLSDYLNNFGIDARYLHSEIDSLERVEILRDLRLGNFDVLVGVNLLREGLDLPEVSLVAIMDADREGFLRSFRSLVQVSGRAARNIEGTVLLYADKITNSMQAAMDETQRRRKVQIAFNKKHNITPKSIIKSVDEIMQSTKVADSLQREDEKGFKKPDYIDTLPEGGKIDELTRIMKQAAKELNFEYAAFLRDQIKDLEKNLPVNSLQSKKRKKPATRFLK